jgi:hypothetical protein
MSEPSGSLNISQILFKLDEQEPSIKTAYLNQSRLSTYYQDHPYGVLSFVNQFNMTAPGGNISSDQGSGAKPNNTFAKYQQKTGVKQATFVPIPEESAKLFNFYSFLK